MATMGDSPECNNSPTEDGGAPTEAGPENWGSWRSGPFNMPFGRRSAAGKRTIVNFFREHIAYFGVKTEN